MDYLREGIHLRGFAQIDPLVAYKNEGFDMFTSLIHAIWEEFARYIFHVEVEIERQNGGRDEAFGRRRGNAAAARNLQYAGGGGAPAERAGGGCRGRGAGEVARRAYGDDEELAAAGPRRDAPRRREGADRPQRPVLVRLGQEVQEVPRGLGR